MNHSFLPVIVQLRVLLFMAIMIDLNNAFAQRTCGLERVRSAFLVAEPGYRISSIQHNTNTPIMLTGGQLMGQAGIMTTDGKIDGTFNIMAMAPNGLLRQLGMGKYKNTDNPSVSAELYELIVDYSMLWRVAGADDQPWSVKVGGKLGTTALITNFYRLSGANLQTANLTGFIDLDIVAKATYALYKDRRGFDWWVDAQFTAPVFILTAQGRANANFPNTVFAGEDGIGGRFNVGVYNGYQFTTSLGLTKRVGQNNRVRLGYQWLVMSIGDQQSALQNSTRISHNLSVALMVFMGKKKKVR